VLLIWKGLYRLFIVHRHLGRPSWSRCMIHRHRRRTCSSQAWEKFLDGRKFRATVLQWLPELLSDSQDCSDNQYRIDRRITRVVIVFSGTGPRSTGQVCWTWKSDSEQDGRRKFVVAILIELRSFRKSFRKKVNRKVSSIASIMDYSRYMAKVNR